MSIEVRNISKLYGSQLALDDVSFSIGKGEIVGLLGPNGAGKSTLMKILTCYIPPTSGNALVCGYKVDESPMEIKSRIGYLPENNPLYTEMYVKEFLNFISDIYRIKDPKRARVAEIIELTGLGREQGKKIGMLSKGYKQRVGLAQALIHDPEVLILDEPTSGLDPNQIAEIRNLITSIAHQKTILLSTHIMQEVEAICQRSIIINLGKIVADDTTSNLSHYKTKELVIVEFREDVSEELLKKINGMVNLKHLKHNTWQLEAKPGIDIRPAISQFTSEHNLTLLTLQQETQKLEDVFKQLTESDNHS
jgi:ABC-2 type transport system ATP-binding protein